MLVMLHFMISSRCTPLHASSPNPWSPEPGLFRVPDPQIQYIGLGWTPIPWSSQFLLLGTGIITEREGEGQEEREGEGEGGVESGREI